MVSPKRKNLREFRGFGSICKSFRYEVGGRTYTQLVTLAIKESFLHKFFIHLFAKDFSKLSQYIQAPSTADIPLFIKRTLTVYFVSLRIP